MFTLTQSLHGWLGTVVGFVIGLIPLIIAHEFGHMLMAKLMGVWAREFGIGYPPRIMKQGKKGNSLKNTVYMRNQHGVAS
jgi:membrane-associated protease RseP (regulator of RpoE activity)